MKRLVHVLLRHGNIVLETARYRLILLMYDTKHCIAVRYGVHQNPDGKKVIYLVYRLVLLGKRNSVFKASLSVDKLRLFL